MIIKKFVKGYVTQVFDTSRQEWISQTFTAANESEYETEYGRIINSDEFVDFTTDKREPYLPYVMKQPNEI